VLTAVMALMPLIASPYALLLMLPFIVTASRSSVQTCCWSTGLLSFWACAVSRHRGLYRSSADVSNMGILSFEIW